jgi:hypothetical protein
MGARFETVVAALNSRAIEASRHLVWHVANELPAYKSPKLAKHLRSLSDKREV